VNPAAAAALLALGVALEVLAPLAAFAHRARPRAAFAFAWLGQAATGAVIVRWMLEALVSSYGVGGAPALAFLVLLVGSYALVPAAAVALYARLSRRTSAALAPLSFAALFVLAEWLRAEPLALPWVLAGHALAPAPLLLQTAELGGAYLPGLVAAAAGAGIGIAIRRRSAAPLAAPAALLALASLYGAWSMALPRGEGPEVRVGVVQASVPQRERWKPGSALRNTLRHVAMTRDLLAQRPVDLAIWSETAVDDDLDAHPELAALLAQVAGATGVPLVTGAPRSAGGRRTNAVVLFDGAGLRDAYDKQRLVPFAEYDPPLFGFLAPLLGPVTKGEGYAAGRGPTVLHGAPIPFSAPICFEITDPELTRRFRAAGARLLVNLSNDAWFGRTGFAEMHLAHAVLRAVELRSFVVRGTNTGISAVVDPQGRVRARLGLFVSGTLVERVRAAGPEPFYARRGSTPALALLAAIAAACAAPIPRRRRA
jgi:apolipoprotein N-acyltransferase